ncbi:MAG: GAF domain-containing sensor histidine kinase [Actinobacteria bacterium]|nr:GAF domain-containing sensor histidine kinase [Actinomycetota bacterium]
MPDDSKDPRNPRAGQPADPQGVSWPLVERRQSDRPPPDGVDRRGPRTLHPVPANPTLSAAPLWPFRLAALAGALVRAVPELSEGHWSLSVITGLAVAYTLAACLVPAPYRNDPMVRRRIVIEQTLNTAAVLLTGAWGSPFVLFFVPTGMLAGFAAGEMYSVYIATAAVVVTTVQYVGDVGVRTGLQDGALWAGLLLLVAFTSGLAHRAAADAAKQQQVALDRVSRLAEANSLLFALQRVAQTLPASLDLDEVLDSTVGRLRSMINHDGLAVYLLDTTTERMVPARTHGVARPRAYGLEELPRGLKMAMDSPKTVRLDFLSDGQGVATDSHSGLYAALRTRGALVGMIAVESNQSAGFGQQQAEVVHGLTEPFGIAIDNARMFLRISTLAADEERKRIARDLHDHVGSSLALIGFEVDRAISMAVNDDDVEPILRELRGQVTAVVADVRETLYDLRTDVSDTRDLSATVREFLSRVEQRSGIRTTSDMDLGRRLPLLLERELWQIVREAVVNAERHSKATDLNVSAQRDGDMITLVVRDNGVGLDATRARPDSYGLMGMRERAHRLDGELHVRSAPGGGTEMRIDLPEGPPR